MENQLQRPQKGRQIPRATKRRKRKKKKKEENEKKKEVVFSSKWGGNDNYFAPSGIRVIVEDEEEQVGLVLQPRIEQFLETRGGVLFFSFWTVFLGDWKMSKMY